MERRRVAASVIVRVVDGRNGRRIVVHDLRSRKVCEFVSWADALTFLRGVAEEQGLR